LSHKVTLQSAEHHRQIVENLFRYYVYDLSEFSRRPCNDDGNYSFSSSLLDPHWSRDDHWPYLVYCGEELAGFCLVRHYPYDLQRYDIDQFFIIRRFRGMGVAKEAFRLAVSDRPGLWQTRVMLENISALQFWRSAINSVCAGLCEERIQADYDLDMHFLMYEIR
jgi:predicted acetyltransferase